MKIKLLTLALVGLAPLAAESKFQGIHLTAQAGLHSSKHAAAITGPQDAVADHALHGNPHLSLTHVAGGISAAYVRAIMDNVHAGVECEYTFASGSGDIGIEAAGQPSLYDLKVKSKGNYAASVVLGYAIGNVLPYAKLGYGVNKFHATYSRQANTSAASTAGSVRKTLSARGLKLGMGTQISLTDAFLFGFEYGYAFGSKRVTLLVDNTGNTASGFYRKATVKASAMQSIMAKFTYRFGM